MEGFAEFYEPPRSYYKLDECVDVEEDHTHEFKGFDNITSAEIPLRCLGTALGPRTRKPISRTINAFLNMGKGGVIYFGVTDSGHARGFNMNVEKMDHFFVKVSTAMANFSPPVPDHLWTIAFVPVMSNPTANELEKLCEYGAKWHDFRHGKKKRRHPHVLDSPRLCWCDKVCLEGLNYQYMYPMWVPELHIAAWDRRDPRNDALSTSPLRLPPLFENEEGKCYARNAASVSEIGFDYVIELSKMQLAQAHRQLLREGSGEGSEHEKITLEFRRIEANRKSMACGYPLHLKDAPPIVSQDVRFKFTQDVRFKFPQNSLTMFQEAKGKECPILHSDSESTSDSTSESTSCA